MLTWKIERTSINPNTSKGLKGCRLVEALPVICRGALDVASPPAVLAELAFKLDVVDLELDPTPVPVPAPTPAVEIGVTAFPAEEVGVTASPAAVLATTGPVLVFAGTWLVIPTLFTGVLAVLVATITLLVSTCGVSTAVLVLAPAALISACGACALQKSKKGANSGST